MGEQLELRPGSHTPSSPELASCPHAPLLALTHPSQWLSHSDLGLCSHQSQLTSFQPLLPTGYPQPGLPAPSSSCLTVTASAPSMLLSPLG